MKVTINSKPTNIIPFKELCVGEVFKWRGDYYWKTIKYGINQPDWRTLKNNFNSINILSNTHHFFVNEEVEKCEAELIIKDVMNNEN